MLEKKHSAKLVEVDAAFKAAVNTPDQGVRVYKALLEDKIKEKEDWMCQVAKKASMKHEELKAACDEASKVKADITHYNQEGLAQPVFSKEAHEKRTSPFKKLEALSTQFDLALTLGTVEEFEKLEKLLK